MKVYSATEKYLISDNSNKLSARSVSKPQTFTGAASKSKDFVSYLNQEKLIRFLQKLKWFDGEQGRILITALGTGAIAPLFIAWNPYVKPKEGATQEEKDNLKRTQKYTAMRQPISAALAIPIQMSLIKPVNNFLDAIFHDTKFGAKYIPNYLNKSLLQDDGYIERQAKKTLKAQNLSKEERKSKIAETVKNTKNEQISKAASGLLESGKIRVKEGENGFVENKSVVEALKKQIREYASDANFLRHDSLDSKELDKIFNDPNAEIASPTKGKEFYLDRAETLNKYETTLKETLGTKLPKDSKEITTYLKSLKEKTSDENLKTIYQEIIDLGDGKAQVSRCQRTLARIETIKNACGGTYNKNTYKTYMQKIEDLLLDRIRQYAQIAKDVNENPQSIKDAIQRVAENAKYDDNNPIEHKIFHDTDTFKQTVDELKTKISKDIVGKYKEMIKGRYRFIKEVAGISLGLFVTVPITCHALNWVYPRFMDIFFPNLSRKKGTSEVKNGGDK